MVIFMTEWVDSDVLNWVGMLRFRHLQRQPSRWLKLLLLCQVLDHLERDYRQIYPDDPPVIDGTFDLALRDLFIP